jgi:glycosyltransferase involved in cell wall biosynthesis
MERATAQTVHDLIYLPLGAAAFGGAERSLLDLAGAMVAREKRVLVLAEEPLRHTPFPTLAAERGIDLEWVAWRPERSLLHNVAEAVRVFRRRSAKVVHFNIAWRSGMWVIPICARLVSRAKLVGTMRAMPDPHEVVPRRRHFGIVPGVQLWRLPDLLSGYAWARALHLTVSVNARDYPKRLVRHYGFSANKMRVIYNGVAVPRSASEPENRSKWRGALGALPGELLVCFSGRVSQEKGLDKLIESLARLPATYKLVVVGSGPDEDAAKTLVRRLGLDARVVFAGFQQDPYSIMAAADVVCTPSLWQEAFGRVVAEAMSLGVPVVASSVGGMSELFNHGIEGLYVPPGCIGKLRNTHRFTRQSRANQA